jgi:hypothetical protein
VLLQTRTPARAPLRASVPAAIVAGSLVLGLLSLLLPTAPTYDPWSWIIWGREIFEGDLSTVDGPSWKPLPVILTTLTAPLGDASAQIWVAVARAGAIASLPLAYLLASRLAGPVAGVAAAVGLGLMPWWIRHNGLGNSEGIMVALVFGVVLAHMEGRKGWAFALGVGAGLLRPEAWPFLGLYALYLLWDERRGSARRSWGSRGRGRLPWVAGGLATLPVLWLGPELWGSGNAFRASDRAQNPNADSAAFADNPAVEVARNAIDMTPAVAVAGAVVAVVLLVARRAPSLDAQRAAIGIAGLAAAWIGLVAVMTVRGFSGNQRYLMVPSALLIVLGAVGIVWLARELLPRRAPRGVVVGALAALALSAALAGPDADALPGTFRGIEYQVQLVDDLETLVADAGGKEALKDCGHAYTGPFLVPQVAWRLGLHINEVDLDPEPPAVVFHVKTIMRARWYSPGIRAGAPHQIARRGGWILSSECPPR